MKLSMDKKENIQNVIVNAVRKEMDKNQHLRTGARYTHFCYPLLGKDNMSTFFFIQSLGTTFLTSVYRDIAIVLANGRFRHVATKVKPHNLISTEALQQINRLMADLENATIPVNKPRDIQYLRQVCQTGEFNKISPPKIDIWLEGFDQSLYLIDIAILNPNKHNFKKIKKRKQRFLEWMGTELAQNYDAKIEALMGIPYNPYYPKPYQYWVIHGMLDRNHEIKVAEDLWDFIGGEGAYTDLLECFEQAGIQLRAELDAYFQRFI